MNPRKDFTLTVPRWEGVARAVALVVAAGVVAGCLGLLGGRPIRLRLGLALVGSLLVSLPRTAVLLAVLGRLGLPGVLVGAAVSEVLFRAATGFPGLGVVPLAAGLMGEAVWSATGRRCPPGIRLALVGAVLAGARVLAGWLVLSSAAPLPSAPALPGTAAGALIVFLNILLGAAAGLLVARLQRGMPR